MAKNRINTASFREIKSSFKRFLSLLVMSALGVAVFVGLKMASPDMIKSLDTYYDSKNVYDIKIISTLGLTNNDIDKLKKIKDVEEAYGSFSKDTIIKSGINESVIKVIGINDNINRIDLIKGNMPKKSDEIVVEDALLKHEKLNVGSYLEVLDDSSFKNTYFKIVGVVKSPLYLNNAGASPNRGNTNLGTGKINYYTYALNDSFNLDSYTEIYMNVSNTINLQTDSKEYKKVVNKVIKNINKIRKSSEKVRYNEIYNKYVIEIKNNKLDGERKLSDSKNKLDIAKRKLDNGKEELENNKIKLDNAKVTLDNTDKNLKLSKTKLQDNKIKLDYTKNLLDENELKIKKELENFNLDFDDINNIKDNKQLINQINDLKLYKNLIKRLLENRKDLGNYFLSDNFKAVILDDTSLNNIRLILNDDTIMNNIRELDNIEAIMQLLDGLGLNQEEKLIIIKCVNDISIYSLTKDIINNDSLVLETRNLLSDDNKVLELENVINSTLTNENICILLEIDPNIIVYYVKMIDEFSSKKEEYLEALNLYNEGITNYEKGTMLYNNSYNEYQNGLASYQNGIISYNNNLNLYNLGINEYYDGVKKLNNEILKAEEKLKEIPDSKWYVYSRGDNNEYASFIDDGKSVSNLSKLFPTIFYVVAVLISLISMSRMVEDDRLEIGTLKSLGFSNKHISKKYLLYSGVATLLGGLIGGLIGFFALPVIIWNIYKILFSVPVFAYSKDITNVIIGILIEIVCICGTTLFTIRKVLKEKPSELMRPKAPSNGKRVLLEKVPFIWKRINFSNKITVRNLFRYKKRVIMTIFGILGCTSLMLAGFGIRDSIIDVPTKQFKEIFYFDSMAYLTGNLNEKEVDDLFSNKHIKSKLSAKIVAAKTKNNLDYNIFIPRNEENINKVMTIRDNKTKKELKLENNKVIVTEKLARLTNKKVGDRFKIYEVDGKEYSYYISGICENYVGHYVYMNKQTYEKTIRSYHTNIVYYKLDDVKLDDKISKRILENDAVMNVSSVKTTTSVVNDMLKSLDSVVFILIFLSGSLSFVVLYNLSYINISERKREIATLKVLGFTDKEVDNYIIKEMTILTIIGIVFGLLLGIVLTNLIINTVEIEMVRFLRKIDLISYFKVVGLVLLFNIIVGYIIHIYLRKVDMIESLKSVE